MSIFNKKKTMKDELFIWLDNVLSNSLPNEVVAINFNIYEDGNNKWSLELVGTSSFDENDSDWACDEVFTTRNNPFVITLESDWKTVEDKFSDIIKDYLNDGKYSNLLKKYKGIGIGFVDGDLSIIYKS